MNENQAKAVIAGIISTAYEAEKTGSPFPESYGYLAVNSNMHDWELIRKILIDFKLVTINQNCIELTESGRKMAIKLDQVLIDSKI
jgi:hypothetical protein